MTDIFIPTYHRAENIKRVFENIEENTAGDYHVWFILERNDSESIVTCQDYEQNIIFNDGKPCYADCINTAYHQTDGQYFFCGADDLNFHPKWLELALLTMKVKGIDVVGTNDLGSPEVMEGNTATHFLVRRSYIKKFSGVIGIPDTVLYPYAHNYCDTEFIETAKARGGFMAARHSIVEHLHWAWGKAKMDETYRKGLAANDHDKQIFDQRKHLWTINA